MTKFAITADPEWLKKIVIEPWGEYFIVRAAPGGIGSIIDRDHGLFEQISGEHAHRVAGKATNFTELD